MDQFQFPSTRHGLTRKFDCGLDIYLTVNLKPDGQPGEVFVKLGKQGTTVSGLMQAWAVTISAALQRGVPWSDLREKYVGSTFEPRTDEYTSLVDAVTHNVDEMVAELAEMQEHTHGQLTLPFQKRGDGGTGSAERAG